MKFLIFRNVETESYYTALQVDAVHIDIDPKIHVGRIVGINELGKPPEVLVHINQAEFPMIEDCADEGCKHLVKMSVKMSGSCGNTPSEGKQE